MWSSRVHKSLLFDFSFPAIAAAVLIVLALLGLLARLRCFGLIDRFLASSIGLSLEVVIIVGVPDGREGGK